MNDLLLFEKFDKLKYKIPAAFPKRKTSEYNNFSYIG